MSPTLPQVAQHLVGEKAALQLDGTTIPPLSSTSTSTSTSPSHPHLLALPSELLTQILLQLLPPTLPLELSICRYPPTSMLAVRKTLIRHRGLNLTRRHKGLPTWLLTCRRMLGEGLEVVGREFVWVGCAKSGMRPIKRVDLVGKERGGGGVGVGVGERGVEDMVKGKVGGKGVLNRRVLEGGVIRSVVLDWGTPAWIKDTREEDDERMRRFIVDAPFGISTSSSFSSSSPPSSSSPKQQTQHTFRLQLWPSDALLLNHLHRAGVRVKQLSLHWVYHASCAAPNTHSVLYDAALHQWVGSLDSVRIRVGSEAENIPADPCARLDKEAEALVEAAARRLVGGGGVRGKGEGDGHRVKVRWGEDEGSVVDERFHEGHWMRQRRVLCVERFEA